MTKQNIHGVVLLDKPSGMSSNQALQKVKWLFSAKKAGHTGSLDPLATGLLPICFGQATKVSAFMLDSSKRYETVIKLGQTTDTYDSEGQVLLQRDVDVSAEAVESALPQFRGAIEQVPPMYSALKKDGQPLYKLARQGKEIERPARPMFVHELTAELVDDTHLKLEVHCSSGFYIRSLAYDLGEVLGCGAHVTVLRRTTIKSLTVQEALSLAKLEQLKEQGKLMEQIQPIDVLLEGMPSISINEGQQTALLHGKKPVYEQPMATGLHRFYSADNTLFGIGEQIEGGTLKSNKIFVY